MLAADEDIANKVAEMAKQRDSTVFQTVNDILEQALRADGMGLNLSEIIDNRGMLEDAQKTGFAFIIERLLYDSIDLAHQHAEVQISDMWFDMGRWYGNYFNNKSRDAIDAFQRSMQLLTLGTSEFSIEKTRNGKLSVSCVGEKFTSGFTEVFSLFIEGVFQTLGYNLFLKENSKGIIRLAFEKQKVI
jgi:hypothetical protein